MWLEGGNPYDSNTTYYQKKNRKTLFRQGVFFNGLIIVPIVGTQGSVKYGVKSKRGMDTRKSGYRDEEVT